MLTNIKDFGRKIKSYVLENREEFFVSLIIILVGTASYGVGILAASGDHPPIEIRNNNEAEEVLATTTNKAKTEENNIATQNISGQIVASKNGSAFYFLNCSGAKRILEQNKVYFNTTEEAQKAGYHLAGNCHK